MKIVLPQWCTGTFALNIKVCAISIKCQIFFSQLHFVGMWRHVDWCKIPWEDTKEESSIEKYS